MPQYRQFGQTGIGSNRRVCVPHKYHLFRIGLLTYTSCSCTVATLSHTLWGKPHGRCNNSCTDRTQVDTTIVRRRRRRHSGYDRIIDRKARQTQ